MRQYKVGIIGAGVISRVYLADIQAFYRELEIVSCGDIDPERAKVLAEEFGVSQFGTVQDVLDDPEIDIVLNLTPPQFHVDVSRQILNSGKHLFSEKPFAPTVAEARGLEALAAEKSAGFGGAPDTFLSSGLQSVRYYLDGGIIGKPFFVTMNMTTFGVETWHPNPMPFYRKGAGPLYDMAPYYLSSLVSLLGPIDQIAALSTSGSKVRQIYQGAAAGSQITAEIPTHYTAILKMKSGVVVNFNISFDIYRSHLPMFEIYGDAGTLAYPDPNFGGGTPKVYRKEQYTDPVFNKTPEAEERRETFYDLPELFPRLKDYSRGIGVLDLACAVDSHQQNRTNGAFLIHITEAIEGMIKASETGSFYQMETTCERPAPLKAGGFGIGMFGYE